MDKKKVLSMVDHTLLKQGATFEDIKILIDDAVANGACSVCISPCFVKEAKEYAGDRIKICTVIGFPNGTVATDTKIFETDKAIQDGANEVDMVINVGMVKAGAYDKVKEEIANLHTLCHVLRPDHKRVTLKVIIETCLLTKDEIRTLCKVVKDGGADFIKTSTGFSTGGATFEDVQLMKEEIDKLGGGLEIKASGGIKDFSDAERFIELGATRLGTSRLITHDPSQSTTY